MNEERIAKQVIVMRNDLNMRKGKMIAQGAHASTAFLISRMVPWQDAYGIDGQNPHDKMLWLSDAELAWVEGRFTKICVRVDSEEELLEIYEKAVAAKLEVNLITDSGLTEFNGVPTRTCLAIGPNWADEVDAVTGHLKLL